MLVGRHAERQQVDAVLAAARLGQSGVLVLTGEPGIGKTALLAYAQERATSMQVLAVTGSETERDLPFAGLAQLLRLTEVDLERLPPPQAEALGAALALRAGRATSRFAVGAGLLTLLTRASEDRPVLLRVDDAHLLDLPSQEALAFVARRLLADAVAVVAAARAGEPCRLVADDLPRLPLGGLDLAGTRDLVTLTVGGSTSTELVRRLHVTTDGNPLALQELASDHERLRLLPPDAPAPVPMRLAALYARRGAELSADAQTAAAVAAAVGEDLATTARACALLGVPVQALQEVEDAGLVVIGVERFDFTHPLVRSGLYALVPPGPRRRLHAAIADALPEADRDRRAWHRSAAAFGPDEGVAVELDAVAERAAGRGAYAVATTAGERAATLSLEPAGRVRRWLVAATRAWQAGDAVRTRDLLDRADRLQPGSAVGLLRGVVAARCGAMDDARDLLLAAGAAAPDAATAVSCYAEAVDVCFYLADARGARAAGERIEVLLPRADPATMTLGMLALGMSRVLAGEDGAGLIKAALARPEPVPASADGAWDDASWRALGPLFVRDSTAGRDLMGRVVEHRRAESAVGALPHVLFHIARDEATTDRWAEAVADYSEAAGLAREFGQTTELGASLAGLAWVEARQGRAEAAAHAAEATALGEEFRLHVPAIWAQLALADLALGSGAVPDAVRRYAAVEDRLDALGVGDVDLSPAPELVESLLRTGDAGRAAVAAERYARRAEDKGQPWARARAARSLGLLAPDAEVDRCFGAAVELHAATLDVYEEALTRLAWGARLRRQRRRVDARVPLGQALEILVALGARPWAEAAADELAATGMTVTRPGRSPRDELTPRELRIAVLLAEGRTTRQVAGMLFLSPKTVEYHLRHVYTKLGIDSRAQLAGQVLGASGRPST